MADENTTPDQTQIAAPVLSDELMTELLQDPSKLHEHPKAIRDQVQQRLTSPADEIADEPPPIPESTKADEPAKEEAPPKEDSKAEDAKEPDPDNSYTPEQLEAKRAELKRLSDEANKLGQKIETAKKREERAKKKQEEWLEKNPEKKLDDPWDEKHQQGIANEIHELKKELAFLKEYALSRDKDDLDTLTRDRKTADENRVLSEIETLQADPKFGAIRMKKSFSQANQEYAAWLDNLVQISGVSQDSLSEAEKKDPHNALRQKALERYDSDPVFKESVKVAPPEETEQLSLILQAFHRKEKQGGNLKGHLFEILDEAGVLGAVVQRGQDDAARTAANKAVTAMKNRTDEIQTIDPSDGVSKSPTQSQELTPQTAAAFMTGIRAKQDRNEPLTPDDRKMIKKIAGFAGTLKGG